MYGNSECNDTQSYHTRYNLIVTGMVAQYGTAKLPYPLQPDCNGYGMVAQYGSAKLPYPLQELVSRTAALCTVTVSATTRKQTSQVYKHCNSESV